MTPSRTCRSVKGSIILCSSAMRRIQLSGLTDIHFLLRKVHDLKNRHQLLKKIVVAAKERQCSERPHVLTTRVTPSSICPRSREVPFDHVGNRYPRGDQDKHQPPQGRAGG